MADTCKAQGTVILVDHIMVHEGGDIRIKFKFAEDYGKVTEYIEAYIRQGDE